MMDNNGPYIMHDDFDAYFGALPADQGFLYLGPMGGRKLDSIDTRKFFRQYGITEDETPRLRTYTLPEIRNIMLLTNTVLDNTSLDNEELLYLNRYIAQNEPSEQAEMASFYLREESEDEEEAFRHTYQDEVILGEAIINGDVENVVRLAERMDADAGRLSQSNLSHWRNLAIIGIAISSRAAIQGGLSPRTAYQISGYYIQKCDSAQNAANILRFRNRALEEMTVRIREMREKPHSSNYVDLCKVYVREHYREKIYLSDVADTIGLSETYLSRLFHKETGTKFQDYVTECRIAKAADLLTYSDKPISEVADYVGFPSQSYMGKMFVKYKGVTPKTYRDQHSIREVR
jgi:AraC-like DNA-binding protein